MSGIDNRLKMFHYYMLHLHCTCPIWKVYADIIYEGIFVFFFKYNMSHFVSTEENNILNLNFMPSIIYLVLIFKYLCKI